MKNKNRIVIEVVGGVVQRVHSDNVDVEIIVADFDNIEADGGDADQASKELSELTREMHEVYYCLN